MRLSFGLVALIVATPAMAQQRCNVTPAAYQALQTGDTLDEARRKIGCRGSEQSRTETSGIVLVMQAWQGPPMRIIVGMFQNDRLVSKSQVGLDD